MDNPQQQAISRLKESTNVLVTVSNNPSVDQLAAAIGVTILLNKIGKHAAAVFSGQVPPALEFLEPEKTIEKDTNSLRDFIISLDKAKADKLRYKVEDNYVKIFITPYKTSISQADLEFSQGDLNVDTVLALGVQDQNQLDQAITAHGRILHDATIISISTVAGGTLGSINWTDEKSSSYGEMLTSITDALKPNSLDAQIATALLTGIVAETARFSNAKTTPGAMSASAKLMAAGANQQLVASELQPEQPVVETVPEPVPAPKEEPTVVAPPTLPEVKVAESPAEQAAKPADGSLAINHEMPQPMQEGDNELPEVPLEQIHIDEEGQLSPMEGIKPATTSSLPPVTASPDPDDGPPQNDNSFIVGTSNMGGTLNASDASDDAELSSDPLSVSTNQAPILSHNRPRAEDYMPKVSEPQLNPAPALSQFGQPLPHPAPMTIPPPTPFSQVPVEDDQTLVDLERAVNSPHVNVTPGAAIPPAPVDNDLDDARDAVSKAINHNLSLEPLEPLTAVAASPLDLDVQAHDMPSLADVTAPSIEPLMPLGMSDPTPFPPTMITPDSSMVSMPSPNLPDDGLAMPPPVPPPITPMPPMQSPAAPYNPFLPPS